MDDINIPVNNQFKMNAEINNNSGISAAKLKEAPQVSSFSKSPSISSNSGSKMERKTSLQDIAKKVEDKRALFKERGRSMSDGEARRLKNDDPHFEVFPSLPNSVLEKLGLRGDGPREHMSEEELEQKFTSLALAFTIDAATIKDRRERQKRSRDQTETNLNMEIERLREKLTLMQPLCTDYEKAELFSTIVTQIDTIMNAISLVSMSAERFGSVQHEERLTESVGLMVSHVQMLKKERDTARRQLQYSKKVLQNSSDSPGNPPNNNQSTSPVTPNRKIISQRRASIATFTQQPNENKSCVEVKKIARITSDLTIRNPTINRISRPNRLDLGGELVKIKEGYSEMELSHETENISDTETEESQKESLLTVSSPEDKYRLEIDISKLSIREKVIFKFGTIKKYVEENYESWTENGRRNEVYTFCALLCFSFSLIILFNLLVEFEYAKRGNLLS